MCSVHADSSRSVFGRLAIYAAMTRERLEPEVTNLITASAVDLVVHLQWVGGVRQVTSVREVIDGIEGGQIVTNELWRPGRDGRGLPASPPTEDLSARLFSEGFDTTHLADGPGWWRT
jgi:Flp pilus assembly CpaF family ATPase